MKVIAAAGDFEEAVHQAKYGKPHIAIISTGMITAQEIKKLRMIRKASAKTKLILVAGCDPSAPSRRLSDIGVCACLSKNSSLNEMEATILQVNTGRPLPLETPASSSSTYTGRSVSGVPQLTPKEFHILTLLGKGKTSREIATLLNTSYRTVEVHRYHLLKKMDCKKTSEMLKKMSWTDFC
jgi:two-component system invasion response regulator UvrY